VIKLCVGKNTRNCVQYFLTLVLFTVCTCCILICPVCIVVVVLCVLLSRYVCLLYCVCTAAFTLDAMATSTQGFLGFPLSISKR